MLYKIELYYLHELFNKIIRLPTLPIQMKFLIATSNSKNCAQIYDKMKLKILTFSKSEKISKLRRIYYYIANWFLFKNWDNKCEIRGDKITIIYENENKKNRILKLIELFENKITYSTNITKGEIEIRLKK